MDFETHGPAGNDFQGDWVDLSAAFDQWTDFAGTDANQAWAQGYLHFRAYGDPSTSDWGVAVDIDVNGRAPKRAAARPAKGVVAIEGANTK